MSNITLLNNYQFFLNADLPVGGTSVAIKPDVETGSVVTIVKPAHVTLIAADGSQVERMEITAAAGIMTIVKRGIKNDDTNTADPSLQEFWGGGQLVFVTIFAGDIVEFGLLDGDNTWTGINLFDKAIGIPIYANAAARDAAITSPRNGMAIYNTALATAQDYIAGSWVNRAAGSTPNGSETVSGKWQGATLVQQGNHVANGSQGPLTMQSKYTVREYFIYVPAYLTGGTGAESTALTWAGVNDGSFRITIDGVAYNVDAIDFTTVVTMADVASTIEAALQLATGGSETVIWDTDHFVITSGSIESTSAITVTTTSTGTVGTDISGAGASDWMDCDTGNGVVTNAVQAPASAHANRSVLLGPTGKIDSDFIDGSTIDAQSAGALVDTGTYVNGEDILAGKTKFVEDMITFASSTSIQNIGDVNGNKRVGIPGFGSGVAANSFNLSLKKFVAPSVDLNFRIETDNAGDPSGTLIDPRAISNVLAANLTTSLANTKVYLDPITDDDGQVFNSTGTTTNKAGYRFQANKDLVVTTVTKNGTCTATRAILETDGGVLIDVATFVGNVATFATPTAFATGDFFRIECDNNGANYTYRSLSSPTYPVVGTNVTYNTGSLIGANNSTAWNIESIGTAYNLTIPKGQKVHIVAFQGTYGAETVNATNYYGIGYNTNNTTTRASKKWNGTIRSALGFDNFVYASTGLFDNKLLSKTSALYSYKLPTDTARVSTAAVLAGDTSTDTIYGINDNFSSLTPLKNYYLSDTAGEISLTEGTFSYFIGASISANKLDVLPDAFVDGTTNILMANNALKNVPTQNTLMKSIQVGQAGTYNYTVTTYGSSAVNSTRFKIKKNGVDLVTIPNNYAVPQTTTGSVAANAGDTIEVWSFDVGGGAPTFFCYDFQLKVSRVVFRLGTNLNVVS